MLLGIVKHEIHQRSLFCIPQCIVQVLQSFIPRSFPDEQHLYDAPTSVSLLASGEVSPQLLQAAGSDPKVRSDLFPIGPDFSGHEPEECVPHVLRPDLKNFGNVLEKNERARFICKYLKSQGSPCSVKLFLGCMSGVVCDPPKQTAVCPFRGQRVCASRDVGHTSRF